MLEDLLTEILERGYALHYLRGAPWEASITRALTQPRDDGYRFAVGYGRGPTPADAIEDALAALETDFEFLEPPTCVQMDEHRLQSQPAFDLMALITKDIHRATPNPFRGKL